MHRIKSQTAVSIQIFTDPEPVFDQNTSRSIGILQLFPGIVLNPDVAFPRACTLNLHILRHCQIKQQQQRNPPNCAGRNYSYTGAYVFHLIAHGSSLSYMPILGSPDRMSIFDCIIVYLS